MRKILMFFLTLGCSVMCGGLFAATVGLPVIAGGIVTGVVSLIPTGAEGLRAGIYTEVWTGEMIKAFRTSVESIGWLNKIRSYDQYANNDVIHFVQIGGDPDVLINNITYPIPVQSLADADKAIKLDKYQTKATVITDDELYAISYDKMQSTVERHRDSVNETKYARALHALAPAGETAATPVILTSGDKSTDNTRKVILRKDIITLKKQFDKAKIPIAGRMLVLCPDHVADLLENDQKFADQYYNYTSGKITNLYGFEVYEYTECPYYTVAAKTKLAYGAVPGAGDRQASVAFYAPRMMKATGTTTVYLSEAKSDPTNQQNLYNIRHYFICLPLKNEAIGAIVSGIAA